MLGGSVGAPFAGYVHDLTGSYGVAFWAFLAAYALALPAAMLAGRTGSGVGRPRMRADGQRSLSPAAEDHQ